MFTDNQMRILWILLNQPDKEFYLSEIGRILDKKPGFFQRGINALGKQKFIISEKKDNQRRFRINKNHPLFNEIKNIIKKTYGAENLIQNAIRNIGIEKAFIYGSYAADKMRTDSDIDLLIVGGQKAENILLDRLPELEKMMQREINYKIYSKKEFQEKLDNKDPFLEEILSNKHITLL